MNTIVALSKYGFKLDSLKNDWDKVDKSLLNRELFKSLQKGVQVKINERNKQGFILDFSVIPHGDIGVKENTNSPLLSLSIQQQTNSKDCSPSPFNSIRYAQCVNIAFANFQDINLAYADSEGKLIFVNKSFDLADEIYKEFNKRCLR